MQKRSNARSVSLSRRRRRRRYRVWSVCVLTNGHRRSSTGPSVGWVIKEEPVVAAAGQGQFINEWNDGKSRQYLSQLSSAATFHKSCPISQFMSLDDDDDQPSPVRPYRARGDACAPSPQHISAIWSGPTERLDCANFHSIKSICSLKIQFVATKLLWSTTHRTLIHHAKWPVRQISGNSPVIHLFDHQIIRQ